MSTQGGKRPADTLGARLELLRRELGWSQRKAAEVTGVPFGTWQGMETGRRTLCLDQHVAKIVAATGYDRDWLMWGGPLDPPSSPPMNHRYSTRDRRKAQINAWVRRLGTDRRKGSPDSRRPAPERRRPTTAVAA